MNETAARLAGVYFEVQPPREEQSPLRTDIAGFAGETRRGPVGVPRRIEGWQQYLETFGQVTDDADLALALRGYFENGGEIAHVIRLLGAPFQAANAIWQLGQVDSVTLQWIGDAPSAGNFSASSYRISATSPGHWGNDIRLQARYSRLGNEGQPQVDLIVTCQWEPTEYLTGLTPEALEQEVAERSGLIRLEAQAPAPPAQPDTGPLRMEWQTLPLTGGVQGRVDHADYLHGATAMATVREVALIAFPDLHRMPGDESQQRNLLANAIAEADSRLDRQVLASLPPETKEVASAAAWISTVRQGFGEGLTRSLAVYHPWLEVEDPFGKPQSPHRRISPVGHVAGVISRFDRERGAHYTPANAALFDAIDVVATYPRRDQALLLADGVNLVRCQAGRGLQIWGGRTAADPARNPGGVFLAHRRLTHRLVRAIRRVAEPLVFDINGPALRLMLVRAITGVLLEAYRAGGLKGERPEEGFQVVCDESNNPEEEQDLGRVRCEISLAPAVPMEFIVLQVTFSADGRLEVIAP
ncbi:MAG: phage tail sheath subtilisin-like domain-containing protein [Candidatus Thiodiazotropha sp. (ex Dulcina madagascariensis)]|nr:phage tail sheath subtilisin-like domain-containing protein [Candidatus Thiodiazotropha sp. (ex Dulcina madagascariensis)]MCU7925857.1 phage tail sheath subtilisin-like domain-containing protein [Candidatus Thiodiazotropha sp. (ex Dulcina madagascariensis)]